MTFTILMKRFAFEIDGGGNQRIGFVLVGYAVAVTPLCVMIYHFLVGIRRVPCSFIW
jgi:hypothetical protein